jgi:hypothetical protein
MSNHSFFGMCRTPFGSFNIERPVLKGGALRFFIEGTAASDWRVDETALPVELFGVDETLFWRGSSTCDFGGVRKINVGDLVSVELAVTTERAMMLRNPRG